MPSLRRQGRLDEADDHLALARQHATQTNRPHNALLAAVGQAGVAADRGDVETAARMLGWIGAVAVRITGDLVGDELDAYRETEAAVLTAVGRERLAVLLAEGRSEATATGPHATSRNG